MANDPEPSLMPPNGKSVAPLEASWCLPNGMRSSDVAQGFVPFPDDVAALSVDYQHIGDQSGIFDVRGEFFTPVVLSSRVLVDGPILVLRLETVGTTALRHSSRNDLLEESSGSYSFSLLDNSGCQVHHRSGAPTENLAIILTAERVRHMLEGVRVPGPVQRFLDGHMGNFGATPRLSTVMRRIAGEIRNNPYTDGMASLYRQGRVCDMLASVLGDLAGSDENAQRDLGADKRRAMAVRDLLMTNLTETPSVEVLAAQVGLSPRRLNEVFRDVFGMAVFEWLRGQRLNQAAELLMEGSLSLKEVAFQAGYAHQPSFIRAFTSHFGKAPSGYRKVTPLL